MAAAESSGSDLQPRSATPEAEQALEWMRASKAQDQVLGAIRLRVRRRRQRHAAFVSAACVAMIAGAFFWRPSTEEKRTDPTPTLAASPPANRATIVSAPRREILADGTVVLLKSGAEISAQFTPSFRRVVLEQGEAHFQVTQNAEWPFIVAAGGVEVRAVGTAFSVQLDASAVEILVTEGRVAVDKKEDVGRVAGPAAPSGGRRRIVDEAESLAVLDVGHRAIIPLGATAAQVSEVPVTELSKRLAWRVPQLEFSRTPLVEVLALMNDYANEHSLVQIVIDPESADLLGVKLSGFLAADNTDGLVRMLETQFKVQAEVAGSVVTLRKAR